MEQTTNNNIKIVRLQSGEDIIADYIEKEDGETAILDNPMHLIFKRIPSGQTVMMMMPWLPIEIIKDNHALIYTTDILTIIDPKEDLVEYYGDVVIEAHQRMDRKTPFYNMDEMEEGDEEDIEEEFDPDEIFEAMKERKKGSLH
jgi:hypothetical protein